MEQNLFAYIGEPDQLMSVRDARLLDGRQDGVRMIQVDNGGALECTLLPGRAMDLYQVRYKGANLNYIAPCGITAPAYYDARGTEWLRGFYVGFLTTCGLQHIGSPAEIAGESRGLHGREANCPAEDVRVTRSRTADSMSLTVEGSMREARIFGENLRLRRTYAFSYGEDAFTLTDTVTNCGFGARPFLLSYHINFGYPLLCKDTKIVLDSLGVEPRDAHAEEEMEHWREIEPPAYPYQECCYFHELAQDAQGQSGYTVYNPVRRIGVRVSWNHADLPYFCQWKMLGKGEYVLGMEPLNAPLDGKKIGEEGCLAPILQPGESKTYSLHFSFIEEL